MQFGELGCMLFYVYILLCADGKYYVGYTKNFSDRLARHQRGEVKFTQTRLPVEVKVLIAVPDQYIALKLEDYFKTGSGRAFASKHFFK
jgi:putative endonuclease